MKDTNLSGSVNVNISSQCCQSVYLTIEKYQCWKEHLWKLVNKCWKNISQDTIEKFIQRTVQTIKNSKEKYFNEKAV